MAQQPHLPSTKNFREAPCSLKSSSRSRWSPGTFLSVNLTAWSTWSPSSRCVPAVSQLGHLVTSCGQAIASRSGIIMPVSGPCETASRRSIPPGYGAGTVTSSTVDPLKGNGLGPKKKDGHFLRPLR